MGENSIILGFFDLHKEGIRVVHAVHDEIVAEVPAKEAEKQVGATKIYKRIKGLNISYDASFPHKKRVLKLEKEELPSLTKDFL